jgi:hypothetical protein
MSNRRRDYIVKFLREEEIERIALTWLHEAGVLNRPNFNIVYFVTGFLSRRLRKKALLTSDSLTQDLTTILLS